MARLATKVYNSETHAYLLWKTEAGVEYCHCGTVRSVLRELNSQLMIARDPGVEASPRELTEVLDKQIGGMDVDAFADQLQLENVPSEELRGMVIRVEALARVEPPTLDHFFPDLDSGENVMFPEDIPENLLPGETSVQELPDKTSSDSNLEQDSGDDIRVQRENEYKERSVRDRGNDQHSDDVKEVYEHQCAVCQLSLKNPTDDAGVTYSVEAAHIEAANKGGPDTLRNRVALCPNHHWAFDNGWISFSNEYTILVKQAPEYEGYDELEALQGRKIVLPDNPELRPHPHFLTIHRNEHGFNK